MSRDKPSLRLKIGDVPKFPFVNNSFGVAIHLLDDSNQLKCGEEYPLYLKLCFDEKPPKDCEDNILVIFIALVYEYFQCVYSGD